MSRPIHVRDVVEDRPKSIVVSHAIVEEIHETRYVATVGDV